MVSGTPPDGKAERLPLVLNYGIRPKVRRTGACIVTWGGHSRGGNGHQPLKSVQHLIVGSIIRDLVRLAGGGKFNPQCKRIADLTHRIHLSDDSGNSRQPSPPARNDAHILVRVLAGLSLSVGVVVEVCDGLAEF